MDEELLSIGEFAASTGISVRSLRHYDEIGLLPPAAVDAWTGYRRYRVDQVRQGRAIKRLRDLDVPLDEVPGYLAADDRMVVVLLRAHRGRVGANARATGRLLSALDSVIDGREALVPATDIEIAVEEVPELRLAAVVRHLHDDEVETELPRTLDAVRAWLDERGTDPSEPPVALFRSGDKPGWHLVEAGWPVPEHVRSDGLVNVHLYPRSRAAVHEHLGPYRDLPTVSPKFIAAVAERGLRPSQAIRIVYFDDIRRHAPDESLRARLVWPVEE